MPSPAESPRPILVPVDFSRYSRRALLHAADMATALAAPIVLLHVVHDPPSSPGSYRKGKKDPLRPMDDVAVELLDDFLAEVRAGRPDCQALAEAETMLVQGVPVSRIIEVANKIGAQQIIMGSQGRTGLQRLLIGSKAIQVAQLSQIPITIVPDRDPR